MTDQLKPLSKEERERLLRELDRGFYSGIDFRRALLTIDELERELAEEKARFESYIHNAAHAAKLDRDEAESRQKKLVEALKIVQSCEGFQNWGGGKSWEHDVIRAVLREIGVNNTISGIDSPVRNSLLFLIVNARWVT